ncbi:hypothetical protein L6164_019979 [Bauhinia variegata]|uniref:Uncharacterized protein n=1 Tax=Bauhinia variegata TaxID=167791 RepID=A0ACB9MYB0_BAUVA|nr:hypothetical protein L6164_019979 [Bauhinia variegata]
MGNCTSSDSAQVVTAKLIVHDGRLQEFPYPVKVSYVLQKYPMCFICNSDEMDFDDVVRAINEEEELQPGQLYFALPLSRLRHRLPAEEMAALAVKASSALTKSSGGDKYCSRREQIVFSGEENAKSYRRVSPGISGASGVGSSIRGRSNNGGGTRNFRENLSAIPE